MDPLSTTNLVSTAIGIVFQTSVLATKLLASSILFGSPQVHGYAIERFGFTTASFILFFKIFDVGTLQEMHLNINAWTDEQALGWRMSMLATYNAISVASAIFATIGVAALQLPQLSQVHWITRAFFATGVPIGTMSLLTSTLLQRKISSLSYPLTIRLWLSRGRPEFTSRYSSILQDLPLEASVSAIRLIQTPSHLLAVAGGLFMVGSGLLLLLVWIPCTSTGADDRNIFIFLIFIVAFFSGTILVPMLARTVSETRTTRHYSSMTWPELWNPELSKHTFQSRFDEILKGKREFLDDRPALQNHLSITLQVVQKLLRKQSQAKTEAEILKAVEKYRAMLKKCMLGLRSGIHSQEMTEI